ncbi:MAG: hypothetical protein GF331_00175 [Chitinivibrionales bacterium]|nr:hypothetical protein [Chitinivibrionales bacterium]
MKATSAIVVTIGTLLLSHRAGAAELPIDLNERRYDMIYVNDNPSDVQTTACVLRMHDLGIVNLLGIALDESRESRQRAYDETVAWVDAARADWGIGSIPVWEGVPDTEARDAIVEHAKAASAGDELFILIGGGTFVVADALALLSDRQEENCVVFYVDAHYNDQLDPGGVEALKNSRMQVVLGGLVAKSYDRPKGKGCTDGNTCDFSLHDEGVPITPFTCDAGSYTGWWTGYAHGNNIRRMMIEAIEIGGSTVECQDADGLQMAGLCPPYAARITYDASRTLWDITDFDNQAMWRGKNVEDNWKDILNGSYPPPGGQTAARDTRTPNTGPVGTATHAGAQLLHLNGRVAMRLSGRQMETAVADLPRGAYLLYRSGTIRGVVLGE